MLVCVHVKVGGGHQDRPHLLYYSSTLYKDAGSLNQTQDSCYPAYPGEPLPPPAWAGIPLDHHEHPELVTVSRDPILGPRAFKDFNR